MRASDSYLVNVLAALDSVTTSSGSSLYDDTLVIRTADHGELGVAHGGLRQKNFNSYEESIRVRSSTRTRGCSDGHVAQRAGLARGPSPHPAARCSSMRPHSITGRKEDVALTGRAPLP
jgi:hypothetical protein